MAGKRCTIKGIRIQLISSHPYPSSVVNEIIIDQLDTHKVNKVFLG